MNDYDFDSNAFPLAYLITIEYVLYGQGDIVPDFED